jgi:hypothetical protein
MLVSTVAELHFPPGVVVSHAHEMGLQWKMMTKREMMFIMMNMPDVTQSAMMKLFLLLAIRISINEILSLIGTIAMQ